MRIVLVAVALAALAGPLAAEPAINEGALVLDRYLTRSTAQRDHLKGTVAQVNIEAEVPRLNKKGRLSALRHISSLGRLTYDVLRFEGDNSVRNHVIARYLAAEVNETGERSIGVTPENYKFSYKGRREFDGRAAYLFELKPRAKRKGLFKGTLWIDAETCLPVREAGRLVKNPSVFIKRVEFTRDYRIQDGRAMVARLETTVQTRIAGPAYMKVHYTTPRLEAAAEAAADNQE